jgi:sugar fermentation stimulation protein A
MERVKAGQRATLCFCVQRDDVHEVRPADSIDPAYGRTLRKGLAAGVEVIAYAARVSPEEALLYRRIPVIIP